jgi:Transposase DDE domain
VTSESRGYDAGKKISGRKLFGLVDTLGLLLGVVVVAANVSDNAGGIDVVDAAAPKSSRLTKLWRDGGFKKTFAAHCRTQGIHSADAALALVMLAAGPINLQLPHQRPPAQAAA